jgi:hypothetical protein
LTSGGRDACVLEHAMSNPKLLGYERIVGDEFKHF